MRALPTHRGREFSNRIVKFLDAPSTRNITHATHTGTHFTPGPVPIEQRKPVCNNSEDLGLASDTTDTGVYVRL